MGEKAEKIDDDLKDLTDEELKVLSRAMATVETKVFHNVVRKLSSWILVVLSALLVGGLINLGSCYSNVENTAAQKLANDPELRDRIIAKAQERLRETQERIKELEKHAAELEADNARGAATFVDDLQQIRLMIERISNDLVQRLPPGGQHPPADAAKKQ